MEDKLRDLKEKMNRTLLKDLDFHENRKRAVLRKIKEENPSSTKLTFLRTWRFTLSTVLTTSLLLGLSLFVADQLEPANKSEPQRAANNKPDQGEVVYFNENYEYQKDNTVKNKKSEMVDPKEWKDLSSARDLEKPDFATNVKDWVPQTLEVLNKPIPDKYTEAGVDQGYYIYLQSESIRNVLGKFIRVEGEDLEKDFENLQTLIALIGHHQFIRTAHIDPNGNAKEKREYMKDWKPTSETTYKAFEYMKQLLHDIDVAINKDGKGETFGVSHQLDGQNVKEFEVFLYGSSLNQ
jgi:hypothetical protein